MICYYIPAVIIGAIALGIVYLEAMREVLEILDRARNMRRRDPRFLSSSFLSWNMRQRLPAARHKRRPRK